MIVMDIMGNGVLGRLKQLTGVSNDELQEILLHFQSRRIEKKAIVLEVGRTAREVYFITKGCMRLFYVKEGVDISAYFFTENMFAGAYDSFITQKPSMHSIAAVEDCDVLSISHEAFHALLERDPRMNGFVRKVLEERFVSLHQLFTSHILDSPEERYRQIMEHRPDLLARVPQHQIATFLGITPVSLSRIRNRVAKR